MMRLVHMRHLARDAWARGRLRSLTVIVVTILGAVAAHFFYRYLPEMLP